MSPRIATNYTPTNNLINQRPWVVQKYRLKANSLELLESGLLIVLIGQLHVDKLNFLTLFELSNLQCARSLDFQDQVWEGQRRGVREILLCTVGREGKVNCTDLLGGVPLPLGCSGVGSTSSSTFGTFTCIQQRRDWRRENQVLFPLPSLSPFCPG